MKHTTLISIIQATVLLIICTLFIVAIVFTVKHKNRNSGGSAKSTRSRPQQRQQSRSGQVGRTPDLGCMIGCDEVYTDPEELAACYAGCYFPNKTQKKVGRTPDLGCMIGCDEHYTDPAELAACYAGCYFPN